MIERAMKAAKRYAEMRGMVVVGEDGKFFAAWDGDELAVIAVSVALDELCDIGEGWPSRREFERATVPFLVELAKDGYVDFTSRFDCIDMQVVGESQAFLRHSINCLDINCLEM